NKNAVDGSLKNEAGVDWFAFQEALGKLGYMGIIDIEGPKNGATEVDAADTMFVQNAEMTRNPYLLAVFGIGILAGIKWYFTGKVLNADYTTQEGFDADFETKHFWK
ncbi:hypothetical protein CMK18_21230, partial [Candidatus Poribacteria bacterium]|nr:hypothetical protein [Candidatus Poribacteria bacterium]